MKYSLRSDTTTHYGLGINNYIILESILEKQGIEYDSREGYIEHLKENLPEAQYELNTVDDVEADIILIKRNEKGGQKVIIPNSNEYNEICSELIELSL